MITECLKINGFIDEEGFSIIEALVSIVIIGITSIIIISFLIMFLKGTKFLNRMDALSMVQNEIQSTLVYKTFNDTSYANLKGNLILYKKVNDLNNYYQFDFSVKDKKNILLIDIPVAVIKNESN